MKDFYEANIVKHRPWKKALCVLLSVIIAFGTFVVLTVGSSRLQDWLGMKSLLSAYAAEIVDTKGAVGVNEKSMLADNTLIELENKDGSNTVYMFSEPISYTDENGNLKTKDISVEKQADKELKANGYTYSNGQNDYRINFSSNSDSGIFIEHSNFKYSLIPQSKKSVTGRENMSVILNEEFEDFEYKNIYGEGTNLKFYPQLNGIKDEIVLDSKIEQNMFSFELVTDNCSAILNDDGTISLVSDDNNESVQTFTAPFAYDSEYVEGDKNEHYTDCSYSLDKIGNNTYIITVAVDKQWLENKNTVYPVVIDPTTGNLQSGMDVPIHSKRPTASTSGDNNAVGVSSFNGASRTLVYMGWPGNVYGGSKINSAYYYARELTARTSGFGLEIYRITSAWNNYQNWTSRPDWDPKRLDWVNINGNYNGGSNYWYKFNISEVVQSHVNGADNRGFMMKYDDEDGNANLRTFGQLEYPTSSMRPYIVINYTKDTTAPTVTSVTGNAVSWTKNNVTLTVNGAKDNDGGVGLHSAPYSFSTTKGNYSWQSSNTKTFSSNGTVYIYVRDALDNIRLVSTQTIEKIDKTAPTASGVTGNPTSWTNNDVTLAVNGAEDLQSGLNSSAYSFSTTPGAYSWQESNSKTFSVNGTVYVYVRDAVENTPALISTVTIDKIDKTKPSKPTVTGNAEEWANGDIELTAQSSDSDSGVAAYSFSTTAGKYNWQSENTYTVSQKSKLYICSKDNAGNISEPSEVDLKIDKLAPTGTVNADGSTDWAQQVVITANVSDEISGLPDAPYSFSTNKDSYNWQSENKTTVTSNGTYYIYARDSAGNITLLDTVTIDKIDRTSPSIKGVDLSDRDKRTIITVTADDSQSGVSEYSIDNGKTWQISNVFEIDKDSLNYVAVKVKDKAGNTAIRYYDIYTPQLYYENGKVGIYNPNPNCSCDIYYKLNGSLSSKWIKYDRPFAVDKNQTVLYLSFYLRENKRYRPPSTPVKIEYDNIFTYSETDTDLSLAYNGVSFNIDRQYKNGCWDYSINSNLEFVNDNLIKASLPDFNSFTFVKQNKYLYLNESNNYELAAVYDKNDNNIVEYILKYNNINYHYDINGKLIKISNSSCDLFGFNYTDNVLTVEDGAGRKTVVRYENNRIVSITDANGGVVRYFYANDNLVKVTDQANVIIGEYHYDGNLLTKSGRNNIKIDSENRVSEIVADNGYSTQYTYSDNTVTIHTSDGNTISYTYDFRGNILTSTDEYGSVTAYSYDSENRLVEALKNGQSVATYLYSSDGRLAKKTNESGTLYYHYNAAGELTGTEDKGYSSADSYVSENYVYDETGNIILKAQFVSKTEDYEFPAEYESDFNYTSVVKYTYQNGLSVKTTDDNGNTTIIAYDEYGNTVKTTNTVIQDNKTTVSISENSYDNLGRLILSKSNNGEISYVYDAAGRTLLVNTDGSYQRTVYDNYGRTVQEISNADYNPEGDNLPNDYPDKTVGHRYIYDNVGNLVKEINDSDIETTYVYSDVGTLRKKSFDIYNYYYENNGQCDKIDINGKTIVNYDYKVSDSDVPANDDQYINRVSYADGYVEEQALSKNGTISLKYANGKSYYYIYYISQNKVAYCDENSSQKITVESDGNSYNYLKQTASFKDIFSYNVQSSDDAQTITEKHFGGKEFKTVTNKDSVSYISPLSSFEYKMGGDENSASLTIGTAENSILKSIVSYDETNNALSKSYDSIGLNFKVTYDDNGNIISDGNYEYTYDKLGELLTSSGASNATYSYDGRGNVLSKVIDGTEIKFAYNNVQWQDQLTSVNDTALTYDANGNLTSYGGLAYSWSHGKQLESVSDGNSRYTYKYDSDGIRASKTVNGVTTNFDTFNGRILAQYDGSNNLYFQYYNDAPIGFILNDVQYFYVTNLNGDIVAITDSNGNLIAKYSYDDWGKVLGIETAEENNAEQLSVAEINPLRYRGYYYDAETGMYYLQSRYYNPELCRFISADDFNCLDTSNKLSSNAYAYCLNCPVSFHDVQGTTPELSINLTDVISFIQNVNSMLKNDITAGAAHLKEQLSKFTSNFKKALKTRYNAFIDKMEYCLNYPDAVVNSVLSKLFNTDVNIRFRLIEFLREKANVKIDLSVLKVDVDESGSTKTKVARRNSPSKSDESNIGMAIIQGLVAAIELDWLNDLLKHVHTSLEELAKKSFEVVEQVSLFLITSLNVVFNYFQNSLIPDIFNSFDSWFLGKSEKMSLDYMSGSIDAKGIAKGFDIFISIIDFFANIDSAGSGGFTMTEDIAINAIKLIVNIASAFLEPFWGLVLPSIADISIDVISLRFKGLVFKY